MNYFEFYNLPVRFAINKTALRHQFFELSKKFHPDFYANENEEVKESMLKQSTLNNNAFKTLNNDSLRLQYVLNITETLTNQDKEILPQDFLMEMMELNEAIMEADKISLPAIRINVAGIEEELKSAISQLCESYDKTMDKELLNEIKTNYLKEKYLLRIKESMLKFAAQ